jgi:hypothetical protein
MRQMGAAAVEILVEDNRKMENINVKLDEIQSDLQIANKVGWVPSLQSHAQHPC